MVLCITLWVLWIHLAKFIFDVMLVHTDITALHVWFFVPFVRRKIAKILFVHHRQNSLYISFPLISIFIDWSDRLQTSSLVLFRLYMNNTAVGTHCRAHCPSLLSFLGHSSQQLSMWRTLNLCSHWMWTNVVVKRSQRSGYYQWVRHFVCVLVIAEPSTRLWCTVLGSITFPIG